MTTLRDFQNEIEEIHVREVSKQRAQAQTQLLEKESLESKKAGRLKESGSTAAAPPGAPPPGAAPPPPPPAVTVEKELVGEDESDQEYQIQRLLLSNSDSDSALARDLLAAILTRTRGEFILRLGSHPLHHTLFDIQPPPIKEKEIHPDNKPLSLDELKSVGQRLITIADEIGAVATELFPMTTSPHASYLLRLPPPSVSLTPEVRCAVVGNVDSGKSTTLGVLTRGALDDGRGRARVGLFRHKHEVESGRTSSVGMEILGFGPNGAPVLPATAGSQDPDIVRREKMGWDEIASKSAKIVSFIDLAGHERYLKTTLYGLTSGAPSVVLLMVGANAGLIGMSKEHLAISLALGVPVVVCITKIDMTPANVQAETVKQVVKILKSPGCRKTPVFVKSLETAVELSQVFVKERLCPIFQVSNVTGEGLDYIRMFLNLLPSSEADEAKFVRDQALEYSVTEVWSVPYVGTVVNGIINSGTVRTGDALLLGPDSNGGWMTTAVKSMQRKRAPVSSADAGQCVSFALKRVRRAAVRKGMVIVSKSDNPPRAVRRFEGQVLILYHNTTMQKNYQAMLHCGAVRQTVRIVSMDHPQGILRTGDRATVEFEFISHPEFIKEGMKLLFREGKTKGLGVVTRLL